MRGSNWTIGSVHSNVKTDPFIQRCEYGSVHSAMGTYTKGTDHQKDKDATGTDHQKDRDATGTDRQKDRDATGTGQSDTPQRNHRSLVGPA
jgi:hypothetical protein